MTRMQQILEFTTDKQLIIWCRPCHICPPCLDASDITPTQVCRVLKPPWPTVACVLFQTPTVEAMIFDAHKQYGTSNFGREAFRIEKDGQMHLLGR